MVDLAVVPGQISRADLKEHSHHVNHGPQKQQTQKFTRPINKFNYETITFVVLTIDKTLLDRANAALG